jgi:hypothetical protein
MTCKNSAPARNRETGNILNNVKVISVLLIIILLSHLSYAYERQNGIKNPPNTEGPTIVNIGLFLLNIIHLDQPKQMLRARYALSLNWKDPRLAFKSKSGKSVVFIEEEIEDKKRSIWWPDPQITNQLGEMIVTNKRLVISPGGDVLYSAIFVVDTKTTLEFRKFPFDSQFIRIEFESFSFNNYEMDYKVWSERTGINQRFQNDEWILHQMSSTAGIRRLWESEIDNWSFVSFRVQIERRTAYYLWRILFPFCFFILLSTCVFWMQRESLDRRVSIVGAFALTAVAFNFVVAGFFPNVSYLTILDAIILSGYVMCGITIISVISLELLKYKGKEKIWNYGSIAARFVFPLLYILIWYAIYYIFMNMKEQIVFLVEQSG